MTIRRAEYAEIVGLYFLQGAALAMWTVPLSMVLEAHGLVGIRPYAYATSAVAAFVSPLFFGAIADRHASPVKVMRWLAVTTALAMVLASTAIRAGASAWLILALIQLYAFCASPTWSIAATIVFARLADASKEFGPIRAMATMGWMAGCLLVSVMAADQSTISGYAGAGLWLMVAGVSFLLPSIQPLPTLGRLAWWQRLGYDALVLLRNRDHRVVFMTTTLFSIPLAGFYPYAPPHLSELGLERTSAWMSLGQITEVMAMVALGGLLGRWRLKWILAAGLTLGVIRFALSALDTRWGLVSGVILHGGSFALVMITAQIYLNQRVDPAWRGRGQALMALLNGGVGNMIGYLGVGQWFGLCTIEGRTRWPWFWAGLSLATLAVLVFFLATYRGRGGGLMRPEPDTSRE